MKRHLKTVALELALILLTSFAVNAQCVPEEVVYGFGSVPAGSNSFGEMVGAAGDVDNDGHADFFVVATRVFFAVRATVTVYSGLTGDSIRTYYKDANTVRGASAFGDYNSDNYDDLLINGMVISGLTGDTLKTFAFGSTWGVSAGDVNLDGFHDMIDPDDNYSGGTGRVELISGVNGDTLYSWIGHGTLSKFGQVVDAAGDFDNDGVIDILIGEPNASGGGTNRGGAYVYSGKDGSQLFRRFGLVNHTHFGSKVSGAGDLNGDGFDDILISSIAYSISGDSAKVWAYSGQTGALLYTVSIGAPNDKFGYAIDALGDISNDGYGDFAVAAPGYFRQGNIYIFSGVDGSLIAETYDRFAPAIAVGASLAGVGDTDGDGSPDFVTGSPSGHDPDNPDQNNYYRGSAHLFRCAFPSWECQRFVDFDHDLWSNVCDNCDWFPNVDQSDLDGDGLGDLCDDSAFLRTGHSRYVQFKKANWQWSGTYPQLTFDSVSSESPAYLELTTLQEQIPGIRKIPFQMPMKYTFTTDAIFEGMIRVKLPYLDTNLTIGMEEELQLLQKVDGAWRNITTVPASPAFNIISGETYSLGEFALGGCLDTPDDDADGIAELCDNCPYAYNPNQEDLNGNGIGDLCESGELLSAGGGADVTLSAVGASVDLNFSMVDQAGAVNLAVSPNGPASDANFNLFPSNPPRYYHITTDALYSGEISITLNYDDAGMSPGVENSISLRHYENNRWVDITVELNTDSNYIKGVTTSLSPFTFGLADIQTAVEEDIENALPSSFKLGQNYPNPFNPRTVVSYSVSKRSQVLIEVFNILGQKVITLVDEDKSAGEYQVSWDGSDSDGHQVSSGIYLYRYKAGEFLDTKKMLLLK